MTRRAFLGLGMTVTGGRVTSESGLPQERYELARGVLSAADHELEEGYFAVGVSKGLMLMTVPRSTPWERLKEQRGRVGRVLWEPQER